MKNVLLLISLLFLNFSFAGEIFQFRLEKAEKLQGTYTAEFGNGNTIHFALIKNTDTEDFLLTPFLADQNNTVKKMDAFVSKEMFSILSYHINNGVATIVNYDAQNKKIQVIDYDLATGKFKSSDQEMKTEPNNIFRLKNKTLLVTFDKKLNMLNVKSIVNQGATESIQIAIPQDKVKLFRNLVDETPQSINQQEFVEKGSIAKRKGYFFNNNLVFTLEKDKKEIQVFNFDLKHTNDFKYSAINPDFGKETKDISNYFYNNKLILLGVDKQDIKLKVFDIATSKQTNALTVNDLNSVIQSDQVNEYIKTALKSAIKSTVTVNKTKSDKLVVRFDNVKEAEYNYNYNWFYPFWFFQQQQIMMMHQQQMMQQAAMNSRAMMGHPSAGGYFSDADIAVIDKKLASLEFVLDADFKVAGSEHEETVYPKIDKEKYLDKYKEDKTMKNFSSAFTDDEVRFISLNPKTKTISISYEKL